MLNPLTAHDNWGERFNERSERRTELGEAIVSFEDVYRGLARQYRLPLLPFLLRGVGGHPDLMQRDGIHPTAEGNRIVAGNVMQVLEPLLRK